MRVMMVGDHFDVYIIRSTNPESFDLVTYRKNFSGIPMFLFLPDEGGIGLPPELPPEPLPPPIPPGW